MNHKELSMPAHDRKSVYLDIPDWGRFLITANESLGLIRLKWQAWQNSLGLLPLVSQEEKSQAVCPADGIGWQIAQQLDQYLSGQCHTFEVPIGILISGIKKHILEAVQTIPYGEILTVEQLSRRLRERVPTETIKGMLRKNPVPLIIGCHRVVSSATDIGNHVWGRKIKQHLLNLEATHRYKHQTGSSRIYDYASADICPQCQHELMYESGCVLCRHCGFSERG